jgi:hypothetical protein
MKLLEKQPIEITRNTGGQNSDGFYEDSICERKLDKTGSAKYYVTKYTNNDSVTSFSFITELVVNNLQLS